VLLADLLGQVAGCFPRRETRQCCGQMVNGLLMELDDHNCQPVAEAIGHRGPHRLQHLLSRPQLAGSLLDRAHALGIRAAFVAGDEVYGGRQLRRSIRQRGMGYVMAVRANHVVSTGPGRAVTAAAAARMIPHRAWHRMRTGHGTKGTRHGQVIRWRSWHRWTAVCLLAYIYLAVAVALQREHDASSNLDAGLIPVTVPELLRLLRDIVIPPPRRDRAHRLHWPAWRRRHQHRARQAHRRWNAYAETAP
jgi:hypothetical protein